MTRSIKVAAAQPGPIQNADTREAVVARMLDLLRRAKGCDLIVYPELNYGTLRLRKRGGSKPRLRDDAQQRPI